MPRTKQDQPLRIWLQSSLVGISRMEGDLEAASAKYVYVQKLRAYVADLCHMLQARFMI